MNSQNTNVIEGLFLEYFDVYIRKFGPGFSTSTQ